MIIDDTAESAKEVVSHLGYNIDVIPDGWGWIEIIEYYPDSLEEIMNLVEEISIKECKVNNLVTILVENEFVNSEWLVKLIENTNDAPYAFNTLNYNVKNIGDKDVKWIIGIIERSNDSEYAYKVARTGCQSMRWARNILDIDKDLKRACKTTVTMFLDKEMEHTEAVDIIKKNESSMELFHLVSELDAATPDGKDSKELDAVSSFAISYVACKRDQKLGDKLFEGGFTPRSYYDQEISMGGSDEII